MVIFRPLRLLQRQDEPLLNVRRILEKKVVQKLNFSKSVHPIFNQHQKDFDEFSQYKLILKVNFFHTLTAFVAALDV